MTMNHKLETQHIALLPFYHDLSLIGHGSQATMLKALDKDNRPVAIKVFDLKNIDDWKNADLFEREIAVLKNLHVHGVPAYIETIKAPDYIYLIEEYVDARSLEKQLDDGRKFTLDECVKIFENTARIIKDLGDCAPPVVHRDIKPANLLVDDDLNVYLVDFGVVANKTATFSMTFAGTAGYVAPEQLYGKANTASDIFSLGATMLHLVTGISPCDMQLDGIEPDIDKYMTSKIPVWLQNIIKRMMSVDPEMRPQTGEELINYLEQNKETQLVNGKGRTSIKQFAKNNRVKILAGLTCISMMLTIMFWNVAFSNAVTITFTMLINFLLFTYTSKYAIEHIDKNKKNENEEEALELFSSISEQELSAEVKNQLALAKYGDPSALAKLGCRYLDGDSVIKDPVRGYKLVLNAAIMENQAGIYELAKCYYFGTGVDMDKKKAAYWFLKLAEMGNLDGQRWIASMYSSGIGVEKDTDKAIQWYQKAIGNGGGIALTALGRLYQDLGDKKNAFKYFTLAAEKNLSDGQRNLGLCYHDGIGVEIDYAKARYWLEKAIDNGCHAAYGNLGYMYEMGYGCEQDDKKAFDLYYNGAMLGEAYEQNKVGWFYENAMGVDKDLKQALKWYTKSAEQGNQNAQANLGRMYLDGLGTDINNDLAMNLAMKWLRKAADQGELSALINLGWMYDHGRGTPVDYKTALMWYHKAAQQNSPTAQYNLGLLYLYGRGVAADKERARELFQKSADQGYQNAITKLSEL